MGKININKEVQLNNIYLIAALCMIDMALMTAIQPLYLTEYLGVTRENAGSLNANVQVVTEIVDLFCIGFLGYLSDRFGRVPVIALGFFFTAVVSILLPFSHLIGLWLGFSGFLVFLIIRIIMSLGMAAAWPQIMAITGDYADEGTRPKLMANSGFMMAFGGTLAYAVLMQIPHYGGIKATMFIGFFIAICGGFLAKKKLVDIAPKCEEKKIPLKKIIDLIKKERKLKLTFLSVFSTRSDMVIIGFFLMIWVIYFADLVGVPRAKGAATAGLIIGAIGLIGLASIPVWRLFVDRFGRMPALFLGLAFSGVGFVSFGFVVNPFTWQIVVPSLLIGLGQASCLLVPQILTFDLAPENLRGSVMGAFNMVGCLGVIFFLMAGGLLFDWIGPPAPFLLIGTANLLVMCYALIVMKSEDEKEGEDSGLLTVLE